MEKVNRVFYHELGHFIAKELNAMYFKTPKPSSIKIFQCEQNKDEFCGEIEMDVKDRSDKPAPKERLSLFVAATTYGCLFQAYYEGTTLRDAQDRNGQEDLKDWISHLAFYGVSNGHIHQIECKYFERLLACQELDCFIKIECNKFLQQVDDHSYVIILDELRKRTDPLLENHYKSYSGFLKELEAEIYYVEK